jgi:hypothetical protein
VVNRRLLAFVLALALAQGGAAEGQGAWRRITPTARGPAMPMNDNDQEPRPTRAVRLIFEYEGDRVRLVSEQPVEMAVTGFDLTPALSPGYYVDARDSADRTLARVAARDAFAASQEVFPEDPTQPITRVDVAEPRGAFTVVVPAADSTDHVTVLRLEPPEAAEPGAPAAAAAVPQVIDLVSFPLKAGK